LGISIGLSLLFFFLVNSCPNTTLKATIYISIAVILALSVLLFLYKTENKASKIIIGIFLVALLVLLVMSAIGFHKAFKLSGIFLKEGTKFASSSRSTLLYIPTFMLMQVGFFLIILQEYKGFVSHGVPSFNPS
jgi:predicted lysophospholipase L1 biosynthesis ABC-type transport system permease subunit